MESTILPPPDTPAVPARAMTRRRKSRIEALEREGFIFYEKDIPETGEITGKRSSETAPIDFEEDTYKKPRPKRKICRRRNASAKQPTDNIKTDTTVTEENKNLTKSCTTPTRFKGFVAPWVTARPQRPEKIDEPLMSSKKRWLKQFLNLVSTEANNTPEDSLEPLPKTMRPAP